MVKIKNYDGPHFGVSPEACMAVVEIAFEMASQYQIDGLDLDSEKEDFVVNFNVKKQFDERKEFHPYHILQQHYNCIVEIEKNVHTASEELRKSDINIQNHMFDEVLEILIGKHYDRINPPNNDIPIRDAVVPFTSRLIKNEGKLSERDMEYMEYKIEYASGRDITKFGHNKQALSDILKIHSYNCANKNPNNAVESTINSIIGCRTMDDMSAVAKSHYIAPLTFDF